MKNKLDLPALMHHFDLRNLGIYDSLAKDENAEAELSKMVNWVIPQWFSSSTNEQDERALVENFNENCNGVWKELSKYPKLQTKLLSSCGLGKQTKRRFYKLKRNSDTNKLMNLLEMVYPDIKNEEIYLWCEKNTEEDVRELCEYVGYQEKETNEIINLVGKIRG